MDGVLGGGCLCFFRSSSGGRLVGGGNGDVRWELCALGDGWAEGAWECVLTELSD